MKKCIIIAILLLLCASWAFAAERKIVITAGGDALLGGSPAKRTDARFEQFITQYGYGYTLKNYKRLFSSDDITILNLEAPLKKSARPRNPGKTVNMCGKPEYVNILTSGSVEVVNIVNNHILDYNTKEATKNILARNGIIRSDTKFASQNNSIVVNGVRVGFIGFQTPCGAGKIRAGVRAVKRECDIAVASFHFCEVPITSWTIRSSQIKAARAAINAGADLVLGHHPHVIGGIELYKEKLIFYDLGSIVSSGRDFHLHNMVARITLKYDTATKRVSSSPPVIYPGYTSSAGPNENNCQPMLWNTGEEGYEWVFARIDRASSQKGVVPAKYLRGTP